MGLRLWFGTIFFIIFQGKRVADLKDPKVREIPVLGYFRPGQPPQTHSPHSTGYVKELADDFLFPPSIIIMQFQTNGAITNCAASRNLRSRQLCTLDRTAGKDDSRNLPCPPPPDVVPYLNHRVVLGHCRVGDTGVKSPLGLASRVLMGFGTLSGRGAWHVFFKKGSSLWHWKPFFQRLVPALIFWMRSKAVGHFFSIFLP